MSSTSHASRASSSLSNILQAIDAEDEDVILTAMANEMNNHIYLRGKFKRPGDRLNAEDMKLFLHRVNLCVKTIHLSDRGAEEYRPPGTPRNISEAFAKFEGEMNNRLQPQREQV